MYLFNWLHTQSLVLHTYIYVTDPENPGGATEKQCLSQVDTSFKNVRQEYNATDPENPEGDTENCLSQVDASFKNVRQEYNVTVNINSGCNKVKNVPNYVTMHQNFVLLVLLTHNTNIFSGFFWKLIYGTCHRHWHHSHFLICCLA